MGLSVEWIRYGKEGTPGYFCSPDRASGPLPAVLVLQEAWGVDAHVEDLTRRFALAGYAALAPDLFAEGGERPEALAPDRLAAMQAVMNEAPSGWRDPAAREAAIAKRPSDERERVTETFGKLRVKMGNLAAFVPTVLAAAQWLRGECPVTRGQPVGSIGFCMGGGLSGLLACHDPELAAAVVFYGATPANDLLGNVRCPVLGLYGALDEFLIPTVAPFAEAMKQAGKRFEHVVYEGARHAFFNDTRPSYDVRASRDAFVRVLAFFRTELAA